ncbi:MAG: DUF952 domain-containing protein [Pirellulaceae bacterium]
MSQLVYKILDANLWESARQAGSFQGAGIDVQDGFIHLSAADQVQETARLYFAGQSNLVLVEFDADQLGDGLRWEASRDGQKFPHVYGEIPVQLASNVWPMPLNDDGIPVVPELNG